MNIKNYVYVMRKRISDDEILKLKDIIDKEIGRREKAESENQRGD